MKNTLSFLFLFVLICTNVCKASNYYVSAGSSGNGTLSSPYGTIQEAANIAIAGDTIFVFGGHYSEMNITFKNSGNATNGYIVCCPQPETGSVVITKTNNVEADNDVAFININNKSYIWITGFQFSDAAYLKACITMTNATQCVVSGNSFIGLGNINVNEWDGTAMIWMYNASDCVISNNHFEDITGDAIAFVGQGAKRNLLCQNTFKDLKGKKRSWSEDKYKYSSAITGTDTSFGDNLICFNHITGGQDGIWLDRDGSRNIIVRNIGFGGQRLVFNESRCSHNWIQENIACNMTESGYRSALYSTTGWTYDTRWINNIAYNCKVGIYLHKSKHNEIRNNIVYKSSSYNLICTDSTAYFGKNVLKNNLWYSPAVSYSMQYCGKSYTPTQFASKAKEENGIYNQDPLFNNTATPYDFTLKEGSPCIGNGDENVDLGAYAVYKVSSAGSEAVTVGNRIEASFENTVTEALRGNDYTITIRLEKPCSTEVTIELSPVAGDIREGIDYELSEKSITFSPGESKKDVVISFIGEETLYSKLLVLKISGEGESSFHGRTYSAFKLLTKAEYEEKQQSDRWIEAEGGVVGSLWNINSDNNASGGEYITVQPGNNSNNSAPGNEQGWVKYSFDIETESTYVLWMRTICPNANDDSFWIRIDDDSWSQWNGIPTSNTWQWNQSPKTYYLTPGTHELYIGYREDGAKLDKMLLSCIGTVPLEKGGITTGLKKTDTGNKTAKAIERFDIQGRKIDEIPESGIIIERIYYTDGSVDTRKKIVIAQ